MRVVDVREWANLILRLESVNGARVDELLDALREIVEAEERLAEISGRMRPSVRELA